MLSEKSTEQDELFLALDAFFSKYKIVAEAATAAALFYENRFVVAVNTIFI